MILKKFFLCYFKRYIYDGIINIDNLDEDEVLKLLEACDEFDYN